MSMIDESTHCVVENLAMRHANAKQTLEQARSKEGFDPAALAELEGAEREAWNSWQAAQQLVQELREKTLADEGSMVRVSPKRGWSPSTRRALLKLAKRYRDARRTLVQIARFVDSAVSEHGYKRHRGDDQDDQEHYGKCWWTRYLNGWSEVETSEQTFATEFDAVMDALNRHVLLQEHGLRLRSAMDRCLEAQTAYREAKEAASGIPCFAAPPDDGLPPHPVQPLIVDRGQLRFKPNAIVKFLLDSGPSNMNTLAGMEFTREDREQFAQLIGYSHSGAGDLSYFSNSAWDAALQAHKAGADSWQALAQVSQRELEAFKDAMREPIAALYRVHPSDLR